MTSYPVKDEEANLMVIQKFKKILKNVLLDILTTLLVRQLLSAVSSCTFISKNILQSAKIIQVLEIGKLSSDPEEMKEMVLNIRRLEKLMGSDVKRIQKSEKYNLKLIRRKAVAMHDISKDTKILKKDLKWVRATSCLLIILKKK